ncbi:DNA primase [Hoylesella shahii]|jgi:DNA primase|uniref:DNA primase n=1 Tax=Hoylesella shahii DSM 15611 = JCM 12083 TaxID=1122991 RepID=A0A318HZ59_9BACT|nr:DNA primase [Hoylesella shahii]PXX20128.1 DNA primase [Hoylesella shahii DSM 15611 = JCM 12083]
MIDRATVERIQEAANIVDVVSEFVTLRKAGANYKGLCPFHNERTPSFMVSPARGICHCFGCGRGGNPVTFIMEHEQMTYPEALRWLANKYHIEIQERELSDDERREQNERESMFIINEWAAAHFEEVLHNHEDGIAIGMQYFRSRGFRDDIIRKFRLGFDLNDREQLARTATDKGYNVDFLVKTGLCYHTDDGRYVDRFAGRVIFPWFGVSGKVVGFGGRLLDSRTKGVQQKYVNSPDSDIYHKEQQLYGIFQGKKAIAKEDCVYMVEGYTDVVSMHQCGVENVVANSGTALSIHQIRTLHRFTSNIVLLYDGDEAGIHAALRGTDMLLGEGMNVKVLLFPDGDDPDSFARKHNAEEFRQYIADNQTDFIQFKTRVLLNGVTDPTRRSEAISSIVQSVSVIPNPILRDTYLHDCAQRLGVAEATLINSMNKYIRESRENRSTETARADNQPGLATPKPIIETVTPLQQAAKVERMLVEQVVRFGERIVLRNVEDEEGNLLNLTVAQYIQYDFLQDGLAFQHPIFNRILEEAAERSLQPNFKAEAFFVHHEDIEVSKIATELCMDPYQYLKLKQVEPVRPLDEEEIRQKEKEKEEELRQRTVHLLLDFRLDYVEHRLKTLQSEIAQAANEPDKMMQLMAEFKDMQVIRNELARRLGSEILI